MMTFSGSMYEIRFFKQGLILHLVRHSVLTFTYGNVSQSIHVFHHKYFFSLCCLLSFIRWTMWSAFVCNFLYVPWVLSKGHTSLYCSRSNFLLSDLVIFKVTFILQFSINLLFYKRRNNWTIGSPLSRAATKKIEFWLCTSLRESF